MRLVDSEECDPSTSELRDEALVVEALRGDVEKLQRTGPEPLEDLALLCAAEARIEPRRRDSAALEEVDLILHQRDQRRDHDCQALEEQRRQLVTKALARAGREDGERGPAREERIDDLLLTRPKLGEPEPLSEQLERTRRQHGLARHHSQASGRGVAGRCWARLLRLREPGGPSALERRGCGGGWRRAAAPVKRPPSRLAAANQRPTRAGQPRRRRGALAVHPALR